MNDDTSRLARDLLIALLQHPDTVVCLDESGYLQLAFANEHQPAES
jgi:hypothetical protein